MATKLDKRVRVRIAPSPTGPLHMGTARTALFNWLFARHHGGAFVLRIEDTDLERSDPKFEHDILEGLTWLGINWDEFYHQSERLDIYEKYLKKLLDEQKAYYCYCTKDELEAERQSLLTQGLPPKYIGKCRSLTTAPHGKNSELVRFKVPEVEIEFNDLIRGEIKFNAGLLGDIAIAKDLRRPLYNFAVVVDDREMEISHVIRGEDHIPNTPKQILIQDALGFKRPYYAHLPLILSPNRSKLSKRYIETSLLAYREQGFLPQAVVNFMAFLGWHPKEEKEIMTTEELIKEFDITRVQKSGAIFNEEKLAWLNFKHLNNLTDQEFTELLAPRLEEKGIKVPAQKLQKIAYLFKGRMKTLEDFFGLADFLFILPDYNVGLLIWKNTSFHNTWKSLVRTRDALIAVNEATFNIPELDEALSPLTKEQGNGVILWPLRAALTGKQASPGPLEIAEVLGKKETLERLEIALKKLI